MKRLALLLLLVLALARVAGAPPIGGVTSTTTVLCDGVATGTTHLTSMTVTGLPSYTTQAWVVTVGDWFDLVPALAGITADGHDLVAAPDGRQWKRRGQDNRQFIAAPFWSVSSTGSDEAVGWGTSQSAADTHPLRSLQELDRRLTGWRPIDASTNSSVTALTVHFMDDVTEFDRFSVLHNVHSSSNVFVRATGTLNPVDGSATNRAVTGYQAAVPASNAERQIVISGLGTTPQYVGKIVQTVDGTKTAIVVRQTSADHLSITQVRDSANILDGTTTGTVTDFTVGDHLNFLDASNIPAWPFPPGVPFALADHLQFVASTDVWPTSDLGGTFAVVQQCLFGAGANGNPLEYEIHGGDLLSITASAIFATHNNVFTRTKLSLFSVGVLLNGDGPFFDGDISISQEMIIEPYGSGGAGWRCQGEHPCHIVVADTGSIGAFQMTNSAFALYSTHFGVPGDFVGSDSNTGNKSLFYGSGNAGYGIVVPKGSRCKFPKSGITYTTVSGFFLNIAGIGLGDAFHNYAVSDIPIVDLASDSTFLDSNPGTSGGAF